MVLIRKSLNLFSTKCFLPLQKTYLFLFTLNEIVDSNGREDKVCVCKCVFVCLPSVHSNIVFFFEQKQESTRPTK